MTNRLTIGAFAKAVGVRTDTIRYYERNALLSDPGRTAAGYRLYGEDDLERVRFIRRAQTLGFALKEIALLLSLRSSDTARAADVLEVTHKKIADLSNKIVELARIESALTALADKCPVDAPTEDCPILVHLTALPSSPGNNDPNP